MPAQIVQLDPVRAAILAKNLAPKTPQPVVAKGLVSLGELAPQLQTMKEQMEKERAAKDRKNARDRARRAAKKQLVCA